VEIRDGKAPHWTGTANSPATYGHFGQSGTFIWVDPVADLALVVLTNRDFDGWANSLWPALSDAVLREFMSD
jgi:CubicO group peptidase (beta-lactamase class C family)